MPLAALLIAALALAGPGAPAVRAIGTAPTTGAAVSRAASEAGAEPMVCVIAPRVEASAADPYGRGMVMERPSLVVTDPLREVIVERRGQRPLRLRSPGGVLPTVIPWQGAALNAGERVTLRLRPVGSPAGQGATLQLEAAAAPVLAEHRRIKAQLGPRPQAWLSRIESDLDRNQPARAWALLFDPDAPRSEQLDQLRRQVIQQGCGEPAS